MKKIFVFFIISLILSLALSFLRAYSFIWAAAIISAVYAIATYFALKKIGKSSQKIILLSFSIFLGYEFLIIPLRIMNFDGTKISLWGDICVLLSIALTTLFYLKKQKKLLMLFIPIWLYAVTIGHENWIEYAAYSKYKTGLNISNQKFATDNDSLCIHDIKKKYVLLDFWSSTCGVCFEKFPEVQELYDRFKNDNNILISSVFIASNGENYSDGRNILKEYGYTFPIMGCADWDSSLITTLGIKSVPHVIILNENKEVVFRGSIEYAEKKLKELLINVSSTNSK